MAGREWRAVTGHASGYLPLGEALESLWPEIVSELSLIINFLDFLLDDPYHVLESHRCPRNQEPPQSCQCVLLAPPSHEQSLTWFLIGCRL